MIENELKNNLDDVFIIIKENMEMCFKHLEKNPDDTKKILSVWKNYGDKIHREFMLMSDKYDNNTLGKEITKMIIFR